MRWEDTLQEDIQKNTSSFEESPFPPKHNEAIRPTVAGHIGNELLGSGESVISAASYLGQGVVNLVGRVAGVINLGIEKATGVDLGDAADIVKMGEALSKNVPTYNPNTQFGKDTVTGLGSILEKVDLIMMDTADKLVTASEKVLSSKPVDTNSSNVAKALTYATSSMIGLKEIGHALKTGARISQSMVKSIPMEQRAVMEDVKTLDNIRQDLTSYNARYKVGPDDRPIDTVIEDAINVGSKYEITDKGKKTFSQSVVDNTPADQLERLSKSYPDLLEKKTDYIAPKYKDISDVNVRSVEGVAEGVIENVAPPFFIQNTNPILKRSFDLSRQVKRDTDIELEDTLFGPTERKGFFRTLSEGDGLKKALEHNKFGVSNIRKYVPEASNAGYLYEYANLGSKERAQVVRALDSLSNNKTAVNRVPAVLAADFKHLNSNQTTAVLKLVALFQQLPRQYNLVAHTLKKQEIQALSYVYMPRDVEGTFSVRAWDGDEKSPWFHKGFNTKDEADAYIKKNPEMFNEQRTEVQPVNERFSRDDSLFYSFVNYASEKNPAVGKVIEEFQDKVATQNFFLAARRTRRTAFSEGYSYDPKYAKSDREMVRNFDISVMNHVRGFIKAKKRIEVEDQFNKLLNDEGVNKFYPNTVRLARDFMDKAMGKRTSYNEAIDKVAEAVFTPISKLTFGKVGPQSIYPIVGGANTLTSYEKLIFWRPGFMAANLLAPYTVATQYGALLKSQGLSSNIWSSTLRAHLDMFLPPSKEVEDVLRYYQKNKVTYPSFLHQTSLADDLSKGIKLPGVGTKALELASGKTVNKRIDSYTRGLSGLIYYRQLRSAGLSHEDAKVSSGYSSNHTMTDYSRLEKAAIFDSSMGHVGGWAQSWAVNMMGQNLQLIREVQRQLPNIKEQQAREGLSALAKAKAFEFSIYGLGAGFGLTYIDKALELVGAESNLSDKLAHETPDLVHYGIPQALLDTKISSIGDPSFLGFSMATPEFIAEGLKATKAMSTEYHDIASFYIQRVLGTEHPELLPAPEEIARFFMAWMPKSTHPFIKSWAVTGTPMFWNIDEDKLYGLASTTHGKQVFQLLGKDRLFAELFGGMTIEAHKELLDSLRSSRTEKKSQSQEDALVNATTYMLEQGLDVPEPYRKRMEDLRLTPKELNRKIINNSKRGVITSIMLRASADNLSASTIRQLESLYKTNPELFKDISEDAGKIPFKEIIERRKYKAPTKKWEDTVEE
jgi:hypothetical protein